MSAGATRWAVRRSAVSVEPRRLPEISKTWRGPVMSDHRTPLQPTDLIVRQSSELAVAGPTIIQLSSRDHHQSEAEILQPCSDQRPKWTPPPKHRRESHQGSSTPPARSVK